MRYLIVVALVFAGSQQEGSDFFVKLRDGTIFSSKFEIEKLKVDTDFGKLEIPLKDIKLIKASKHGFSIRVKSKNKDKDSVIDCKIDQAITFKTKHGVLNVKMDDVAEMSPANKKIFTDDNVVAFWDFDDEEGIKTHGCDFVSEDGTSAVKLDLSKSDYIEIPHKDEYSQKETVTIEMRFKFKDLGGDGNYIPLLKKSDPNGYTNYALFFLPTSKQIQMGAYTENFAYPYIYRQADIQPEKWHYMATVYDAKNSKIEVYLDGKKLDAHLQTGFNGSTLKTNDSPITICKDKYGNKNTIWFDFIRISNKARTSEEISEMSEAGSLSGSVKPSADKEFNTVVVTKQGEKYTCKLGNGKIIIENPFTEATEDIEIDASTIGKISYFEYRKEQIDKHHKEARSLIPKLGNDDPEVRDKAQEDLKKIGWIIMPVLEEVKDNDDEEVKTRVKKLMEGFASKKYEIRKDIIEGNGLFLKAWVKHPVLNAKTKYGDLQIKEEDVKGLVFNSPKEKTEGSITLKLKDNSRISGKLLQDKIKLNTDFGPLEIPVTDIISVTVGKDEDTIVTKKSSTLKGIIVQEEFEIESQIGKRKIKKDQISGITTGAAKYEDGNVARGANATSQNNASHLTDGTINYSNYGYSKIGENITVELKEAYLLSSIGMYLYDSDQRTFRYYVEISKDGKKWTEVIDKRNGDHKGWQLDKFAPQEVKYIRVTGTHASTGEGNNFIYILEIEAYCNSESIRTPKIIDQQPQIWKR